MKKKSSETRYGGQEWIESLIRETKGLDISFSEAELERFERFYNILKKTNQKFNLFSRRGDVDGIIQDRIVDSLLVQPIVRKLSPGIVLDLGSGGGFPGIPLSILNGEIHFDLLEGTYKKACHLREVKGELGLQNVRVVHGRAEALAGGGERERYDLIVARSVADPGKLVGWVGGLLRPKGVLITYTGNSKDTYLSNLLRDWPRETTPLWVRTWDTGTCPEKHHRLLLLGGWGKR